MDSGFENGLLERLEPCTSIRARLPQQIDTSMQCKAQGNQGMHHGPAVVELLDMIKAQRLPYLLRKLANPVSKAAEEKQKFAHYANVIGSSIDELSLMISSQYGISSEEERISQMQYLLQGLKRTCATVLDQAETARNVDSELRHFEKEFKENSQKVTKMIDAFLHRSDTLDGDLDIDGISSQTPSISSMASSQDLDSEVAAYYDQVAEAKLIEETIPELEKEKAEAMQELHRLQDQGTVLSVSKMDLLRSFALRRQGLEDQMNAYMLFAQQLQQSCERRGLNVQLWRYRDHGDADKSAPRRIASWLEEVNGAATGAASCSGVVSSRPRDRERYSPTNAGGMSQMILTNGPIRAGDRPDLATFESQRPCTGFANGPPSEATSDPHRSHRSHSGQSEEAAVRQRIPVLPSSGSIPLQSRGHSNEPSNQSTYRFNGLSPRTTLEQRSPVRPRPHSTVKERQKDAPYRDFQSHSKRFFEIGKVFVTSWSEPAESSSHSAASTSSLAFSQNSYGDWVYSKIQRFVIVKEGSRTCVALPINTYNGLGVAKKGITKSNHAIIHTGKTPPAAKTDEFGSREESGMLPGSIRVDPRHPAQKLDPMSRIDFAQPHTIHHALKVQEFGQVNKESMRNLIYQWKEVTARDTDCVYKQCRISSAASESSSISSWPSQQRWHDAYKSLIQAGFSDNEVRDCLKDLDKIQ